MADPDEAPQLDASVVDPARRYDYMIGGKDNFAVDREAAEAMRKAFPDLSKAGIENRKFVLRAVRHLATACGIRQFIDVGFGLPTGVGVHEIAQAVHPAARVLYIDHSPQVLTHGRALLTSNPEGQVDFLEGDILDPAAILTSTKYRGLIKPAEPAALLIFAVLHFIDDDERALGAVRTLIEALPSGSCVGITHGTTDFLTPEQLAKIATVLRDPRQGTLRPRTKDEVAAFLSGLELVDPGIVASVDWHPELDPQPQDGVTAAAASVYAAVARKP
ncbi:SAM-dependent methyltransferase [Actinoplanes sp. NBRC 103695]|uniref:SAM-dependent methyltransferase n=1 Tax=Actinoplanes sp. NBRC 103695 TaxID=3032202 RepID=UPI0024A5E670|nr:SAM-dependent methyltransferase [Actinoplanes sp. NBRC 103695]GLY96550.1 hypothetical protein Acsp02_38050 [Actinoplanes sp. NBRC 103695]